VLYLNSEEGEFPEVSTYWAPTPKALTGMARLCHFEVLGSRWQPVTSRGAVLGRAVPRKQIVPGSTPLLKAMHGERLGLWDFRFVRGLDAADELPPSKIQYRGEFREFEIDPHTYVTNFPFHAHRPDPSRAIGRRDWRVVST